MKKYLVYFTFILFSAAFLASCESAPKKADEVKSESKSQIESFTAKSEGVIWNGAEAVLVAKGEGNSVDYDISIEDAGRYRFEIVAKSEEGGSVWLEDYVGNPDDRTYNITSEIKIDPTTEFKTYRVDGSPLNSVVHPMRLHINGDIEIKDFSFSKLKDHKPSEVILEQDMSGDEYVIAWSDEFNEGTMPDTSKWTYDIGNWGWGNGELQYFTEGRQENARIEDGNLIIEARKDDMGYPWTSARLTTRGKVAFLYGKLEFRAKVPPNKGNWAAGWTLGNDYVDEKSWPYCGEIDILESVGYQMDDETGNGTAHASAHCGAYYFKLGNQPTGTIDVENMNNEYHVYAVEWTPEGLTATVDGEEYFTYNDTSSALSWPFDKPQNLILNLTMGGGWGGLEGMDTTITSQIYTIDYVRVYQKK